MVMIDDIGQLIFVDILRMTQYPGAPFTGNIINDLIMFLLIPTIFIIIIVYMAVGRIFHPGHTTFRLLVGIAAYLFIIAGGYYSAFALLAGPYFIFLIFIMGILFFFVEHFARRGGDGGTSAAPSGSYSGGGLAGSYPNEGGDLSEELAYLKVQLQEDNAALTECKKASDQRGIIDYQGRIAKAKARIRIVEADVKRNPVLWTRYQHLKSKYHIKN